MHSELVNSAPITKLLAIALAVASLGLVTAGPALAQDSTTGGAQPETPTEAQPQEQPTQPDGSGTGTDGTQDGTGETTTESGQPSQEEKDRYKRYCNQPNTEPSHSDKKFCEDYDAKYGATTSGTKPTQEEIDRYKRYCTQKDAEPSHSDKKFCEDYRKKYPDYAKAENKAAQNQPAEEEAKKDDEPDSGPLAFTGLDVWQLILVGLVLVAGGFGARRLLAN